MKFSTSVISAASLLLPAVQAHLYMNNPEPMGSNHNNSPLEADGSNFPCKMIAPGESVKTYTPGVPDTYQVTGSAVHGGGSCQISITYDENPTKDSVFKVIQSYEGSCPIKASGNLPANPDNGLPAIPVNFPTGLKAGKAVFAWTWFNKIGNREMYMNCARVTIGGYGGSDDVYNNLPDMFVANINVPQSQCTTPEGVDIQFPESGQNVVVANGPGVNLGPACNSYKKIPKSPPKMSPPSNNNPTPIASAPTYEVTSRPAFVGNPDQEMPATTMRSVTKPAPMPTKVPNNSNNNGGNSNNNPNNGYNNNNNSNNGGNSNNNTNNGGSKGLNQWGAKSCTNYGTRICNADKVTFNWCDENGSLWENEPCPLRTVCTPGSDINVVPPVGNGQPYNYRRHLAAHKRRSHHH